MAEQTDIRLAQLKAGMALPPEKKFYFNGFTIALSHSDFGIVLLHNDQPIAFLSAPHGIIKTLAAYANESIETFEKRTGQKVLKLEEALELLTKSSP